MSLISVHHNILLFGPTKFCSFVLNDDKVPLQIHVTATWSFVLCLLCHFFREAGTAVLHGNEKENILCGSPDGVIKSAIIRERYVHTNLMKRKMIPKF